MKKYFYHDGQNNIGPFTVDDLKAKNITKETLVWCEGMTDWEKAGNLEELKYFFVVIPPPVKKVIPPPVTINDSFKQAEQKNPISNSSVNPYSTVANKNKSNTLRNVLIGLFSAIIVTVIIVLIVNYGNSNSSNNSSSGSYTSGLSNNTYSDEPVQKTEAELKTDLKATEESDPTKYLSVTGNWKLNLVNSIVIEGYIKSSATLAKFKDVQVKVTFISKTGTSLGTDYFTLYEYVKPGTSVNFKQKFAYYYKNGKSISCDVISAKVAN